MTASFIRITYKNIIEIINYYFIKIEILLTDSAVIPNDFEIAFNYDQDQFVELFKIMLNYGNL